MAPLKYVMASLLLGLISCSRIINDYDNVKLLCGDAQAGAWTKIRSIRQSEYTAADLQVYKRVGNELTRVEPSAKGCVARDGTSTYVVASRDNLGLVLLPQNTSREAYLQEVQDSDLNISCPSTSVPADSNFRSLLTNSGQFDGFLLDLKVVQDNKLLAPLQKPVLNRSDYNFTPLMGLSDGVYDLEWRVENLLKQTRPRLFRCSVQVDNTPPVVVLNATEGPQPEHLGFTLIESSDKIRVETRDASATEIRACWQRVEELDLQREVGQLCELKTAGSEIALPDPGYWVLSYEARDNAQQSSTRYQQKFLVYEKSVIDSTRQDVEISEFLFDKGENFKALQKMLTVETKRRRLATEFERKQNKGSTDRNLVRSALQKVPYLVRPYANIRGMALSPDGTKAFIAYGREQYNIVGLDMQTGKELWEVVHPNGRPQGFYQFSPDGRYFITSGELSGDVFLWDFSTGRIARTLKRPTRQGYPNRVFDLRFSSDQRYVAAAGWDEVLALYDLETIGDEPVVQVAYDKPLMSFAWSPSGQRFLTVSDSVLNVYKRDGSVVRSVPIPAGKYVSAAAFLSENEYVATAIDSIEPQDRLQAKTSVHIVQQNADPRKVAQIAGAFEVIAPSPNGEHFVAFGTFSQGGQLFLNWRQELNKLEEAGKEFLSFTKLDNGEPTDLVLWAEDSQSLMTQSRNLSASAHSRVYRLDGQVILSLGPSSRIASLSRNGRHLLYYNLEGELQFWKLEEAPIDRFHLPNLVDLIRYSPSGRYFLTLERLNPNEALIKVWQRQNMKLLASIPSQMQGLYTARSTRFVGEDRLLYAKDQNTLVLRHWQTGEEEILANQSEERAKEFGALNVFDLSRDQQRLALGYTSGRIEIKDRSKGIELLGGDFHVFSPFRISTDVFPETPTSLAFIGDSHNLLSAGLDGKVFRYTADYTGSSYIASQELELPQAAIDMDVGDEWIALAPRMQSIIVYSLRTKAFKTFSLADYYPSAVAISANGAQLLATTLTGGLYQWSLSNESSVENIRLNADFKDVFAIGISPDARELVTAVEGSVLFVPLSLDTIYQKLCTYLAIQSEETGQPLCLTKP